MLAHVQNEVSIVIPVYNEVDNVARLYQEIVDVLAVSNYLFEVIFVDDGSTDGTRNCLQVLAKANENLKIVFHKKNYGQSAALVSGVKAARYHFIVPLDGDGQNDPADIPRLFEQLVDAETVVLGIRRKREDNWLRKFSSTFANTLRQRVLKDGCPDTSCSLKLFPREAFLSLPHFNHLHRYLPALFKRNGYKLINLPVNHRPREHGVSKYGVMNRGFVGIYDLIGVRWLLSRPCTPEVTYEH